jgi:hypothetical protein
MAGYLKSMIEKHRMFEALPAESSLQGLHWRGRSCYLTAMMETEAAMNQGRLRHRESRYVAAHGNF